MEVEARIADMKCVLHAAGPFSLTSRPMMEACIAKGVHYLDITGEMPVFQMAETLSDRAVAAQVMLMPGVGWDVVPSDCVALHAAQQVAAPRKLAIALLARGGVSRGSLRTAGTIMALGTQVRRDGEVMTDNDLPPRDFDFGDGPTSCVPVPMGDVITAWRSTAIPNIAVYLSVGDGGFEDIQIDQMAEGPSKEERDAARCKVIAEVTDADGVVVRSMIETSSGYAYTYESGIEIVRRVLAGDFKPGFQSPASGYGVELATSVGQSRIAAID